jgi:hypothetical protein
MASACAKIRLRLHHQAVLNGAAACWERLASVLRLLRIAACELRRCLCENGKMAFPDCDPMRQATGKLGAVQLV